VGLGGKNPEEFNEMNAYEQVLELSYLNLQGVGDGKALRVSPASLLHASPLAREFGNDCLNQKRSFNPNWKTRGEFAAVICPYVPEETVETGLEKFARLNVLNASARNCA
jgi:hypothetical protein